MGYSHYIKFKSKYKYPSETRHDMREGVIISPSFCQKSKDACFHASQTTSKKKKKVIMP